MKHGPPEDLQRFLQTLQVVGRASLVRVFDFLGTHHRVAPIFVSSLELLVVVIGSFWRIEALFVAPWLVTGSLDCDLMRDF